MRSQTNTNGTSGRIVGVAIDLGGGKIKVKFIWADGSQESLRGVSGGPTMASAFFKDPVTGKKYFDESAIEQGYSNPAYLAVRWKRDIGSSEKKYCNNTMTGGEVAVEVLMYIKNLIELQTGQSMDGVPATFTAPANYNDVRKRGLLDAATAANFTLLKDGPDGGCLLAEPVAAIVRYAAEHALTADKAIVAVRDLGYETYDDTIAECNSSVIKSIVTAGVNQLGGGYFADALEQLAYKLVAKKLGAAKIDVTAIAPDDRFAGRQKVERLLVSLGRQTNCTIAMPTPDGKLVSIEITQAQFHEMLDPFLKQIVDCSQKSMARANLKPSDIQYHVFVGGPFGIEYLRQGAAKAFGVIPRTDIDPSLAIVEGAALNLYSIRVRRGEIESLAMPMPPVKDVSPHNIGVILQRMSDKKRISKILFPSGLPVPANTQMPARLIYPHQTDVLIQLVICDRNEQPAEECIVLGEARLEDLPLEGILSDRLILDATFNQAGMIDLVATDTISKKSVKVTASVTLTKPVKSAA